MSSQNNNGFKNSAITSLIVYLELNCKLTDINYNYTPALG